MPVSLRLVEDRLDAGAALALAPAPRVLWLAQGDVRVEGAGGRALGAGEAWHGTGACRVRAARGPARLLRYEVCGQPVPPAAGRVLLEHPIAPGGAGAWLMRCDRVDFDLGAVAPPHGHRGGGIRYLLRGALTITVGEGVPRALQPGEAWFESGREPVLAAASPVQETSFLRCAILPLDVRGRSSIVYVDPAEGQRGRPRRYTVYVDEVVVFRQPPAPLRGGRGSGARRSSRGRSRSGRARSRTGAGRPGSTTRR